MARPINGNSHRRGLEICYVPPVVVQDSRERLIDAAARQCDFDSAELRRLNMVPTEAMPVTNAVPAVVAAKPGIVTLADLPPVTGRAVAHR